MTEGISYLTRESHLESHLPDQNTIAPHFIQCTQQPCSHIELTASLVPVRFTLIQTQIQLKHLFSYPNLPQNSIKGFRNLIWPFTCCHPSPILAFTIGRAPKPDEVYRYSNPNLGTYFIPKPVQNPIEVKFTRVPENIWPTINLTHACFRHTHAHTRFHTHIKSAHACYANKRSIACLKGKTSNFGEYQWTQLALS